LYNNLALCLFRRGAWLEAEEACTECLDLAPSDVKALLRRAASRVELGRWDEAETDLARAAAAQPRSRAVAADVKRERNKLAARRREQDARDIETVGGMFDRMHGGGGGDDDEYAVARPGAAPGNRSAVRWAAEPPEPPPEHSPEPPPEPPEPRAAPDKETEAETKWTTAGATAPERRGTESRRGRGGGGGLYDAADVAPPGLSFPMSGRRASTPVTVSDLARELELVEEEEEEAARLARQERYNAMLRAGTLRLADPDFY
jgi:hypothetical protein